MHLSCAVINTISKQTKMSFHLTHITYEFDQVCQKWFASLLHVQPNRAPILRKDSHYLQIDQNKLPFDPRHLGAPSDAPLKIFVPLVRLVQTKHLSCVEINTISK
jgi:hypothetical protein